jgi:hypothetical protein
MNRKKAPKTKIPSVGCSYWRVRNECNCMRLPPGGAHAIDRIDQSTGSAPATSVGADAAGIVVERRDSPGGLCAPFGNAVDAGPSAERWQWPEGALGAEVAQTIAHAMKLSPAAVYKNIQAGALNTVRTLSGEIVRAIEGRPKTGWTCPSRTSSTSRCSFDCRCCCRRSPSGRLVVLVVYAVGFAALCSPFLGHRFRSDLGVFADRIGVHFLPVAWLKAIPWPAFHALIVRCAVPWETHRPRRP